MKILVLGSSGNFGSMLASFLRSQKHQVTGMDRDDTLPLSMGEFQACFLAVPANAAIDFIETYEHPAIFEIGSAKAAMAKYSGRVVSIHPMFGPNSIKLPEFRNIIFIDDISPPGSRLLLEKLFPGFSVHSMSADEHDRLMVELLVKPYFYSMLAARTSGSQRPPLSCTSHEAMDRLLEISHLESQNAMGDTIRLNPFSGEALQEIVDEAEKLKAELL